MMKKTAAFVLPLLLCGLARSALAEEYGFAIFPAAAPEQLQQMTAPLAARLSKETGNPIRPVAVSNAAQYEAELLRGNIVIGLEPPSTYVSISSRHEVLAVAEEGKSGGRLRGLVIARPERGISSLADLKGKRVMIVSRKSAGGFLSQKQTLKEKGIDAAKDCTLLEAADGREENVIISVSLGDADAGFISESALRKADEYIVPGSVAVVAKTALLPNWALSVSRKMPQEQKDDLKAALLRLPENDPAFTALGIAGFKPAQDADYDVIRSLAE